MDFVEPLTEDSSVWWHKATLTRWVDADTAVVDLDLGWNLKRCEQYVRLAHINAPERGTEAGSAATYEVNSLCPSGSEVLLYSHKDETGRYKRIIADVFFDGVNINKALFDSGHAEMYQ